MSQDQAPTPSLTELASPNPTAGAILAAQRRQLGLSIEDVSAKLKLSHRQIEALETDRYDALPGNTFVRGFVRNYARLLQIDAQPLIHYLNSHLPVEEPQAALPRLQNEVLPTLRPDGVASRSAFLLAMAGSLVVVLLVFGGYWYVRNSRSEPVLTLPANNQPVVLSFPATSPAQPEVPAGIGVKESTQSTVLPAGQASATSASPVVTMIAPLITTVPSTPAGVGPGNVVVSGPANVAAVVTPAAPLLATTPGVQAQSKAAIRIVAKQESWVQITDATGQRLINELIPAGQARVTEGKPPYQVRIGNGRQTELYYKGKVTDLGPYIKVDVANLELN
ncbi:RodZ domain-containing protein [Chitinimonas sp. BJB300]|uniref:RodZ domain-containing protein n=1 Tax=Chitinimonas sp. BJB300 TaxID=1559339 RepID=UPI000C121A73|nr:RodZ domain-containing protein [Chitinimonas sp. BJB300]PHV13000.1 hypothetical protein CSQ89_02715 [Chitinimonas sp. BJB300]TSJ88943.1 helix-turn-helix domain-containing protein [Chitinimonas sp. BJB300]